MKNMTTTEEVEDGLKNTQSDLDETYKSSLARIDKLQPNLRERAQNLIAWTIFTRSPLDVKAIEHALAVNLERESFNRAAVPRLKAILSLVAGLVVVDATDETVRAVHETAYQVLRNYASCIERFGRDGPHQYLASVCLHYLSLCTSVDGNDALDKGEFFGYANEFWAYHCEKSNSSGSTHNKWETILDNWIRRQRQSTPKIRLKRRVFVHWPDSIAGRIGYSRTTLDYSVEEDCDQWFFHISCEFNIALQQNNGGPDYKQAHSEFVLSSIRLSELSQILCS